MMEIIKSRRRTAAIEIKGTQVKVRVPFCMPQKDVDEFIAKNQKWIERKLSENKEREKNKLISPVVPVAELTKEDTQKILDKFAEKTSYYAEIMNVSYGRITIRNQRTRWGSCSAKGNLNFNYALYYLPEELMDYVIIHELAHRKQMNHSKLFWNEVEKMCPEYRTVRKRLREYEGGE